MDIKLEAPGHKHQDELRTYCSDLLLKKFGQYPFLKSVEIKFITLENHTKVSIMFKPERGVMNYVSHEDSNDHKAFNGAVSKMRLMVEKYKDKHYHNVHKR